MENEINTINYKPLNLNITIKECNDNQIKFYNNKYFYCENPICDENCPVNSNHAECIKSINQSINNITLNECRCLPGWLGEKCEIEDRVDFSNL